MSEQTQGSFEGWAILEIFGHQKYAGYVTTQTFGTASLFRVDIPELKERERVTKRGCYVSQEALNQSTWCPPGSVIKEGAVPGYTKLFGVGAIYAMTPCTEEACLKIVEEIQPRPLMLVSLPKKEIAASDNASDGVTVRFALNCSECGEEMEAPNADHPGLCEECYELAGDRLDRETSL